MARKPSEKKRSLSDAMLFVHAERDETSKAGDRPPGTTGDESDLPKPYSVRELVALLQSNPVHHRWRTEESG